MTELMESSEKLVKQEIALNGFKPSLISLKSNIQSIMFRNRNRKLRTIVKFVQKLQSSPQKDYKNYLDDKLGVSFERILPSSLIRNAYSDISILSSVKGTNASFRQSGFVFEESLASIANDKEKSSYQNAQVILQSYF